MNYKIVFLFIILSIFSYSALSADDIKFYQPIQTAEKIHDYAGIHIKHDNIGFENYKLIKLSFSYDSRKWHLLYGDGKKIYRTIMIDDIDPCNYEVY